MKVALERIGRGTVLVGSTGTNDQGHPSNAAGKRYSYDLNAETKIHRCTSMAATAPQASRTGGSDLGPDAASRPRIR